MYAIIEPIQFLVELLIAESMFTFYLKRRPHWQYKLIAVLVALFAFGYLWPFQWHGLIKMAKYLILFLGSVLGIHFVFQCSIWEALYRGSAAYASQHIAFNISTFVFDTLFSSTIPFYGTAWLILTTILSLSIYLCIYLSFGKRIRRDGIYDLNNVFLTFFLSIMLLMIVVLNYCRFLYVSESNLVLNTILLCYSLIGCVFALFIQSGLQQHSKLSRQFEIAEHLLHSKQEQFRISEETIDCINLKCHDLKHQLAAFRRQFPDRASQKALKEIESAVLIYDSVVKTGNEALDVILTEKSLICEKNQIQLTCMVDGNGFSSISDVDLYSIFGNIMDNAMESVMQLEDPELRTIGLTVTSTGNILLIHTENYFSHTIRIEDGLPSTTKEDPRFHGFGLKSVRLLADKYGGKMSITIDHNIFNLNILIPISQETGKDVA